MNELNNGGLQKEEVKYDQILCYKMTLNLHLKQARGVLLYSDYKSLRRRSESNLLDFIELKNK